MAQKLKQVLTTSAVLAGLVAGGATYANAQSSNPTPAAKASSASTASSEQNDTNERPGGDHNEASDQVTGAAQAAAKKAALAAVDGKVTEVSRETPDPTDKQDTPEPGDKADPAYERNIAYDVEVTKADGSVVDVHLDKTFKVLGSDKADQGENDHGDHADQADHGEHADQGDGDGENPAA